MSKKGRKEWIEEMIARSKQIKYEKQKERDKTLDLTEQLDKEWRKIIPLIGAMNKKNKEKEIEKNFNENRNNKAIAKPNDYDTLVKSLQFESEKATVSYLLSF
jgi:nucleolar protein 14